MLINNSGPIEIRTDFFSVRYSLVPPAPRPGAEREPVRSGLLSQLNTLACLLFGLVNDRLLVASHVYHLGIPKRAYLISELLFIISIYPLKIIVPTNQIKIRIWALSPVKVIC